MAVSPGESILKLYCPKPIAPDVSRVLACLYEKDVKFDRIDMSESQRMQQDLLSLQTFRRPPVLVWEDGRAHTFESRALCRYISQKYADQGNRYLLGRDILERASIEQWLKMEEQRFDPPSWDLVFNLAFAANKLDDDLIARSQRQLLGVLDVYEERLGETEFLAGNEFSLVDLSHLPNSHYIANSEDLRYLFDSRKNVRRWWQSISKQPSWKKVIDILNEVEIEREAGSEEPSEGHPRYSKSATRKSVTVTTAVSPPALATLIQPSAAPDAAEGEPPSIPRTEASSATPAPPATHKAAQTTSDVKSTTDRASSPGTSREPASSTSVGATPAVASPPSPLPRADGDQASKQPNQSKSVNTLSPQKSTTPVASKTTGTPADTTRPLQQQTPVDPTNALATQTATDASTTAAASGTSTGPASSSAAVTTPISANAPQKSLEAQKDITNGISKQATIDANSAPASQDPSTGLTATSKTTSEGSTTQVSQISHTAKDVSYSTPRSTSGDQDKTQAANIIKDASSSSDSEVKAPSPSTGTASASANASGSLVKQQLGDETSADKKSNQAIDSSDTSSTKTNQTTSANQSGQALSTSTAGDKGLSTQQSGGQSTDQKNQKFSSTNQQISDNARLQSSPVPESNSQKISIAPGEQKASVDQAVSPTGLSDKQPRTSNDAKPLGDVGGTGLPIQKSSGEQQQQQARQVSPTDQQDSETTGSTQ